MTDTSEEIFREDGFPEPPPWKVCFKGNFWSSGKGEAGREIPIGKAFTWGGREFLVPAAYVCRQGLVLDLCVRAERDILRAFMEKWGLPDRTDFSSGERMRLEAEHPLRFDFRFSLLCGGEAREMTHGCSVCYLPDMDAFYDLEGRWAAEHYGLDLSVGWGICRASFPGARLNAPLSLALAQERVNLPGPSFRVSGPGDSIPFFLPADGLTHVLTVRGWEEETVPARAFRLPEMEVPTHCRAMRYTIAPEPPEGAVTVSDCSEGDPPRRKKPVSGLSPTVACAVGVIGMTSGSRCPEGEQAVCSALHFSPPEQVEWRFIFHEKLLEDMTVELLGQRGG